MEPEARGGWQAAIDPSLAARLLRPAVRPGVSDPSHGRALAARLQRMAAPTLADDVAGRYGSTALDADRPPVVYAAPPIQAASVDSQRSVTDLSGTLREGSDAGRPRVRASVRTAGPLFPPLRPLGAEPVHRIPDPPAAVQRRVDPATAVQRAPDSAPRVSDSGPVVQRRVDPAGAGVQRVSDAAPRTQRMIDSAGAVVQRMVDPAAVQRIAAVQRMSDSVAVAMPVVVAQRMETAGGASIRPRGTERSVSHRPVVAPAPTRLQRQIAAEHAEAVSIAAPDLPRVHATRIAGGGGDAPPAAATAGEFAAGPASPAPATAAAATTMVQRRIDPAASHPSPVTGERMEPEGAQSAALPVVLVVPGGGEGAGTVSSVDPAALPLAIPAGTVGGGGAAGGGPIQAIRAHPAEPWSPRSRTSADGSGGAGEGGRAGARPVVAARSGGGSGGTAVQRMAMAAGAGAGLDGAAARMVHAAPTVVVQREVGSSAGSAGRPHAELSTMTAQDAASGLGFGLGLGLDAAGLAELTDRVYGALFEKLKRERDERGL